MCPLVGLGSIIVIVVGVVIGTGNIPYLNFGRDIERSDWDGFGNKGRMMDGGFW